MHHHTQIDSAKRAYETAELEPATVCAASQHLTISPRTQARLAEHRPQLQIYSTR